MERIYISGINFSDFAFSPEDTMAKHRFSCAIEAYETICQKYKKSMVKLSEDQHKEAHSLYENLLKG